MFQLLPVFHTLWAQDAGTVLPAKGERRTNCIPSQESKALGHGPNGLNGLNRNNGDVLGSAQGTPAFGVGFPIEQLNEACLVRRSAVVDSAVVVCSGAAEPRLDRERPTSGGGITELAMMMMQERTKSSCDGAAARRRGKGKIMGNMIYNHRGNITWVSIPGRPTTSWEGVMIRKIEIGRNVRRRPCTDEAGDGARHGLSEIHATLAHYSVLLCVVHIRITCTDYMHGLHYIDCAALDVAQWYKLSPHRWRRGDFTDFTDFTESQLRLGRGPPFPAKECDCVMLPAPEDYNT